MLFFKKGTVHGMPEILEHPLFMVPVDTRGAMLATSSLLIRLMELKALFNPGNEPIRSVPMPIKTTEWKSGKNAAKWLCSVRRVILLERHDESMGSSRDGNSGRPASGGSSETRPARGEILVRNRAIGLNPVDWKFISWGHAAWEWPHIPGVDGAGDIVELGAGVAHLRPGARVAYHNDLIRPGSFAEYTVIPARAVIPLPDALSFEAAAAFPARG